MPAATAVVKREVLQPADGVGVCAQVAAIRAVEREVEVMRSLQHPNIGTCDHHPHHGSVVVVVVWRIYTAAPIGRRDAGGKGRWLAAVLP